MKKSFIPQNKPKSWVVGVVAILIALLLASPIAVIGAVYKIEIIKSIGTVIFLACWGVAAIMWFVFIFGLLTGKYRNIELKEWSQQSW